MTTTKTKRVRLNKGNRPAVAKRLRVARKILARPYGWTKGRYSGVNTTPGGARVETYCALGALTEAKFKITAFEADASFACSGDATRLAQQALVRQIGTRSIALWNDDKATTKKDVLAAFDAAIADVEGRAA